MKIRVVEMCSAPAEIRQIDGRWVVFDRLVLRDTDGNLHERRSDDPAGKYTLVELPNRVPPRPQRERRHAKRPTAKPANRASKR
jgi:hypothetical protein